MRRTAVVTGVGSGLGASLVRKLVDEDCQVGMFARSENYLNQLASELGENALPIPTDITKPDQVSKGFKHVREAFGPIDILINHAGNAAWAGLMGLQPSEFEQAWRVGPFASFLCCQEAVPDMLKQGGGAILFSGATSSIRGRGGALAFTSAKFGVRGLAESLARELWPKGIHIAHIIIDGGIASPSDTKSSPADPNEPLLDPDAMAQSYWNLITQDRSAWTLELDLRPHQEDFFV